MLNVRTPAREAFWFSGHETFACRYAWLPKAYRALRRDPTAFADEDAAIANLGIGKNMVRSCRFWSEAAGLSMPVGRELQLTDFGHDVFGEDGLDPFLEDVRTLWLLHWQIASRSEGPLFAWHFLLARWPYPEFTRSEALAAFARESGKLGYAHSAVTLAQHLDVFLHTYCSTANSAALEDSLDGPLVGLRLLESVGERRVDGGRREKVFAFRRESKSDVSPQLFDWCLADYWARFRPGEETLTLREICLSPSSPGQVFKLPENDVRSRLEECGLNAAGRPFLYRQSAVQGLLTRRPRAKPPSLEKIYRAEP